jgi:hypothetical protein
MSKGFKELKPGMDVEFLTQEYTKFNSVSKISFFGENVSI